MALKTVKKACLGLVLGAGLGGVATAQSWTVDGPFKDDLVGCSRISQGQVQCIIKSTYVGNTSTYQGATYFARDTAAYAPDQSRYIATVSSLNGRDVTNATVNTQRGVPAVVAYNFNYPAQFDKISLLFIDGGMLKEVPIKGAAAQTTPAAKPAAAKPAAQQPVAQPVTQPVTQPAPASTATTGISLGSIDIKLSDCKANTQGGYVCSKAEVNPHR